MFPNVCKHYLIIYGCLKFTFKKVGRIKKKIIKKIFDFYFFCENSKLVYPRYLGYFYYHGTMILPCIRQQETIHNWVTFCGFNQWQHSLVMLTAKLYCYWLKSKKRDFFFIVLSCAFVPSQENHMTLKIN